MHSRIARTNSLSLEPKLNSVPTSRRAALIDKPLGSWHVTMARFKAVIVVISSARNLFLKQQYVGNTYPEYARYNQLHGPMRN